MSTSDHAENTSEPIKKPGMLILSAAAPDLEDNPAPRVLASPFNSPPFPSSDFAGPIIGAADSPSEFALTKLLNRTRLGDPLKEDRIKVYGWMEASFNLSTSKWSNAPAGYAVVPDRPEVNQLILRIERVPDTVQIDHVDWGFRLTSLYGIDYRYTTAKGWFSEQLLEKNELYGFDTPEAYFILYFPRVAEGMTLKIGRYFSPPDIESATGPDNYLFTHSLMYTIDPSTFTGVLADIKLNDHWTLELGAHAGADMTPWDNGALNGHAMVRWVSNNNKDSIWAGVNSIGSGKFRGDHDNLQMLCATWTHKFNEKLHTATEVHYMWQRDAALGGSVNYGPTRRFGGGGGPGWVVEGRSDVVGLVNYFEIQLSDKDYLSIRNDLLDDDDGQRTGYRNIYSSHTIGWSRNLTANTILRPEIRYERGYNLPAYDNGTEMGQFMFAVDFIVKF